jgi:hypothetical protein
MERPKLKLEEAGDEATMLVKYVNEVKTKFGSKLVFVGVVNGTESETGLIPADTADKQLSRGKMDRQSVIGREVVISRGDNPSGKPYWNIDPATPESEGKRVASPYQAPSGGAKNQPFDDPEDPGPQDPWDDPAERHADAPQKAPSVRQEAPQPTSAPSGKGAAVEDAYLALWSRVAERLVSVGKDLEFPVDATGIQAATATIWISWKDRGIQP